MLVGVEIRHNWLVLIFKHLLLLVWQVLLVVVPVVVVIVPTIVLLVMGLHIPVLMSSLVHRSPISVVIILLGVVVTTLALIALIISAFITLLSWPLAQFGSVVCCMIVLETILVHSIHASVQSKQSFHHSDCIFAVEKASFDVVNFKVFDFTAR